MLASCTMRFVNGVSSSRSIGAYRHVARDLFALTCIGVCCAWVITVFAARVLDVFRNGGCGSLLFVGLLVVGMLTYLVRWVRRLNREMRQDG